MNWEIVVGLETHVELATASKIFCSCPTAFGGRPNTQCCPVCMGLPGSLPVLNRRVVEFAARTALALDCTVSRNSRFDRKNYVYPDLPKGYQISQFYRPLGRDGRLAVEIDGEEKTVRIHELHMEEDAGKLLHDPGAGPTRVDYNRCGVPLLEIVTEPDFSTGAEVTAYLEELSRVLRYLGVSDCKMQEGSLRCDVNLSVRPAGSDVLGVRTEMKNLGSLRSIRRAVEYEAARQIRELEAGRRILQETRRWDEDLEQSVPMRTKEEARDYRYFPEPDLAAVELSGEYLACLKEEQPELAGEKRRRYCGQWGLSLHEARLLTEEREMADFFEGTVAQGSPPKAAANWITGQVLRRLSERGMLVGEMVLQPRTLAQIIAMVEKGRINRSTAATVLDAVFDGGDPEEYVRVKGLEQICDVRVIREAVEEVLAAQPTLAADFRAGKEKVFGFLVGQAMRRLQGKADPAVVNEVLRSVLGEG